MTKMDAVASAKFNGVRPNGERIVIQLDIGKLYLRGKYSPDDWACPVSLVPLYQNLVDAGGSDPVHALCLAISLALELLAGFREDGGRIVFDDGNEVPLQSYAFGIAAYG